MTGVIPLNSSMNTALVWTLDPPLLTNPQPGLSYVAINPFRGDIVWEGNTNVNDTTFQLWAQATDIIVAGNYFQDYSGDIRNWALYYQCPWTDNFTCAWQPNIGTDFLDNTLRCAHGLTIATSDYTGISPVNLTLVIGTTRRRNTLLGGTSMLGSGRTKDVLVEHTTYEAALCQGKMEAAGSANIQAENVLIRD